MSKEAITEKRPEGPGPEDWRPAREQAPSVTLAEQPQLARWVGTLGLTLIAMGSITLFMFYARGRVGLIPVPIGGLFVAAGIGCLLFHAASDRDTQVRRMYGGTGAFLIAASILISSLPLQGRPAGAMFLPYGFLGLSLGLMFLLPFVRNETEPKLREKAIRGLGGVGAVLGLIGLIGGNVSADFLLQYGLLLAALGLAYLWAFVAVQGVSEPFAFRGALGIGLAGLVVFLVALGRTVLPPLFYQWGWISPPGPAPYFIPAGLMLMLVGVVYAGFSAGLCLDWHFLVLTRRELAAYFYSPIAYFVLFGFATVAWFSYVFFFLGNLIAERGLVTPSMLEPIVRPYFFNILPVIALILIVPILTMRSLSEEQRTGTLEVLLTAPIGEVTVVLAKFFAAWIFYLLLWLVSGVFLLALWLGSGQGFDYRPLLSFLLALACSGAGFLAMGLFFSSLTRNQIIAAVLTSAGMLGHTGLYLAQAFLGSESPWRTALQHVSYLDLWDTTLSGKLSLQDLLIHLSLAVFWLFLTVKVLESRKWR